MRKLEWLVRFSFTAALLALSACGGGGGGSDAPLITTTGTLQADCTSCGANGAQYSGSGVGVWTYTNTTSGMASVPLSFTNLSGRTVSVVYSNLSNDAVDMPSGISANTAQTGNAVAALQSSGDPAPDFILAQRSETVSRMTSSALVKPLATSTPSWALGDTRTLQTGTSLTPTVRLEKIVTTADGSTVNFWVQTGEFGSGKLSQSTLDTFASRFATATPNIYSQTISLAGKPWGAHSRTDVIGASQPLNIVLYNGGLNSGWGGYFWLEDLYTAGAGNAWLAVHVNTLSLYDTNTRLSSDIEDTLSTLAHEFTHLIVRYQRDIVRGKPFEPWLNEFTAMGMQDWLASTINPTVENPILRKRYLPWLSNKEYNVRHDNDLGSGLAMLRYYDTNGSFSAYLNRQYGLNYYKALFTSSKTRAIDVLDDAIRSAGGPGYTEALRRWGASIAMLPAATAPAGYGYPARSEGGLPLAAFDGPSYASNRALPTTVPNPLLAHGHFPRVRTNVSGSYAEALLVPAGTAVTVVIY